MIELNLLPQELRKKKHPARMFRVPVLPVVSGVIAFLIVVHFLLSLMVMNNRGLLRTLGKKWDQMQPQREKTEKITREINALEEKVIAIRKIARPDLDWARLLTGLNRAVIPNVWLSGLELKSHGTRGKRGPAEKSRQAEDGGKPVSLDITGYALGKSEEATSRVAKFITSLKRNKDFSAYFDEIELQNVTSHEIAGEEVMMFRLNCWFRTIESVPVKADRKKVGRRESQDSRKGAGRKRR